MKLKYVVMGAILGTAVIVVGSNLINASTVQKEALTIDETIPRSGGTLEYGHYSYTNRQVIPGQEQTSALESISLTLCGLEQDEALCIGRLINVFGMPGYFSSDMEQLFLGYRIEVSDGKGIDGILSLEFIGYQYPQIRFTNPELEEAAQELKMAIYEAAPVDYTYQGWYLDGPGVVEMSVRNGKAVFTDKPLLPFQVLRFLRLSKQNQEEPD